MLKVGDPAPDFTLRDQQGNTVRLSDFRGKQVVLYFYPKDLTPGCTIEACDFRDHHPTFADSNVVVFGISPDNESTHARFATKYTLPFPLLADPDHQVAEQYGVWKEKKLFAVTYFGVERTTFLIDAEGRIARIWPKVRVKGHASAVLAALQQ